MRTFFIGGTYWPEPLPSLEDEIARFHDVLTNLARHIQTGTALQQGMSAERLFQGPFADAHRRGMVAGRPLFDELLAPSQGRPH